MEEISSARCLTTWDPMALAGFARQMTKAESESRPFVLNLSDDAIADGSSPAAVRLYVPSVMVVANLLVGRFSDISVEVCLPKSSGLNLQLARGGIFFALANRQKVTWLDGIPEEWDRVSQAWIQPFHPSDAQMCQEALVNEHSLEREAWVVRAAFQRYLLSVIHPHRRPAHSLRSDLNLIARRWLSTRLRVKQGEGLVATIMDCAEIFYEIMVNVPDHAGLGHQPYGSSLGQVYATLGGGRDSHNRLHFSVLDNGVGLPCRVNQRYTDRRRTSEEAIYDAVMGQLPRRVGGRGIGLSRVREITGEYAQDSRMMGGTGTIHIVTNGSCDSSASELEWSKEAEPYTSTIYDVPVQGTLVWVSLGLEKRTPDNDTHQLELTFGQPISG